MAERRFTDLELERKLAGDLSPARAAALEAEATDADHARLAELEAASQAFLAGVDLDLEVRRIEQRAERLAPAPRRGWLRWLFPAGALVAAAAAIVLVFFANRRSERGGSGSGSGDDLMTKGDDISLVIHTPDARLASGDTIAPHTRLRFEVQGSKPGYIAVIGLDGSNAATVYYPYGASEAAALGADRLLPHAIEIDETPGDEQFFAVFSTRPFAIDTVMPVIKAGGPAPAGMTISHVVLHKK